MNKTKTKLYKFAFLKSWFDAGYGATSYIKYGIGFFGISDAIISKNVETLLILIFVYGIFCFILGWAMFHIPTREHNFILAEREVTNQFDFFAKEVRAKIEEKKQKVFK